MALDTPSKRLRWARENDGQYASARDAARALRCSISSYLEHESGDRIISRTKAKKYGLAYRVRWQWLLDGEGEPAIGEEDVPSGS